MPRKSNTIQGKAFEYAVLTAFSNRLKAEGINVFVEVSPAFSTAQSSYDLLNDYEKKEYSAAARTGVEIIRPLEPMLAKAGEAITLEIQTDSQGQLGDVRDVVCIRRKSGWEIGFSCKHNHEALKHPRITQGMDFGSDWIDIPCCSEFKQKISATIDTVIEWEKAGDLWRYHSDVQDKIYLPILAAFRDELKRLCDENAEAPERILKYFFGLNDFYKIIAEDNRSYGDYGLTKVVAFNTGGTLGQSCGSVRPIHPIRKIKMPDQLLDIRIKDGSKTTIVMTFNENWVVSMRLHSADSRVKRTGLKWDIQLKGMPSDMYQQERPWNSAT